MSQPPTADHRVIARKGMRGKIARRMHKSLAGMAQLTLEAAAAGDAVVRLRERNAHQGRPLAYDDILIAAVARTLCQHLRLNGVLVDQEIRLYREIHISLAIALSEGLVAPACSMPTGSTSPPSPTGGPTSSGGRARAC